MPPPLGSLGDRGLTTSRLHLPAAWRRRRPNDPRCAVHLRARWGVEPSQVRLGEDVIGYKNRKTSLATPREANFGFFQSLLVVFAGIGNSKLVTLRPNMASHWNKSTGQSISQESRTCVPTNLT